MWSAVLGCLMHLVTHCGYIVRGYLEGLSLKVVAALLQCCLHHQWCHTLYCQLIRLAVNMLYVPAGDTENNGELDSMRSKVFCLHSLCLSTCLPATAAHCRQWPQSLDKIACKLVSMMHLLTTGDHAVTFAICITMPAAILVGMQHD